ncbi:unnamed protein product [Cylicostephanus goldi]|uniref:Uncharacterized protein n=1 Tax=Cylicostephanus goldi TaxID=71465 RepID=A0A3P6SUM8_CYLGO|nr:unnamed protein product [Cylicostephanus goldi]
MFKFLNLMARMNSCKMVDHETLEEFKRLCENFEHASRIRNQVAKKESTSSSSSAKPKRLSRSRSSSCISPSVVITSEQEKRTRANRARIHRFGNVKNPIDVIDTEDSEEEESIADTSYHPNFEHHTHHAEKRKTRLSVVTDLSPIPDLTHIQHDSTGEGPMSPRSRRQSRLHHPPAPIFPEEKENICNETFLVDSGTSSTTGHPDAGDCAPDDPNPLRNATLVSGLVPDLDADLGPL